MNEAAGQSVADHWLLIVGIGVGIASVLGLLRAARQMLHDEIREGVLLSLSNGAGQRVADTVHAAVTAALDAHQHSCGVRDRVQAQHERLITLENRLLLHPPRPGAENEEG